jgi:hypothetical protein
MPSCILPDSNFSLARIITQPEQQTRTCIIVAGMHRSGTSATTRVINLLGADIASNLLPGNERGHWESTTIYKLHDRLLHAVESAWDDPYPLVDGWLETHAAREAKRAIIEHIEEEFGRSKLFVVKDPRVSRLLPMWLEAFGELSITPIVVIPFRNPIEVAASLERRDRFPLAKSLLIYIQANLEAERASRGLRRVFQLYDELTSDWRRFAEKLASLGGPNAKALSPQTCAEINDFLSTDLRHHRATRDNLASLPDAGTMLVEMYDRMVEVASTGEEASLRACFDRVRERICETGRLYRAAAATQDKNYREEVACLEGKVTAQSQRHDAELGALQSQLGQRDARIEELTALLHERDARHDVLTGELRARQATIEELRAQIDGHEAKLTEMMRRNALANAQISSLLQSTSWRMTAPLRAVGRLRRSLQQGGASFGAD